MSFNNSSQKSANQVKFRSYSIAAAMMLGLVLGMPLEVTGQRQPPPEAQNSLELIEAQRLNQEVMKLHREGKYNQAIPLAKRALLIREKLLGSEHPDVATSLNSLAQLYQAQGNYSKAEPMLKRSLAIREKVLGSEHPYVAASITNLAAIYRLQGSYSKAEPMLKRSLAIFEKVLGSEHPNVATTLTYLASLYESQGNYTSAEPLYLRSLAIYEKVLGSEHPHVATTLNNLAGLYRLQGNYQKAEGLFLRSLAIREKVLGSEHPEVAISLNNLAGLYNLQSSYTKAESFYHRSLAIYEKVLGSEHLYVATSLNDLGLLYRSQGSYSKAEQLLKRSLAIYEKLLGAWHPHVATSLTSLAFVYRSQGNYSKAESLYLRSLAISEKVLGSEHPHLATRLNNLAELYHAQGNYASSEPLYLRSLAIKEKVLGSTHPEIPTNLNNLAIFYWVKGDINRTTDFLSRAVEIEEKNLQLIYAVGSEQRKQKYAQTFNTSTYTTVSLALQQSAKNPARSKLALTTILRRKGRVLDAMTDTVQILRAQIADNPEIKQLFDDWLDVQQELSTIVYSGSGTQKIAVYQNRIELLLAEKERLEEIVSAKSAEFRKEIQPVESSAIQAQIPTDAALVEIVQYDPFLLKGKKDSKMWGKARYAAVVLRSKGEPNWVDLGDAATIDKSVASFRKLLQSRVIRKKPMSKIARALYEQVMAPIRPLLGDARHLLLSPDGQLNLIPFEALKDENNKYLVERYAFSYLTTGRDLLHLDIKAKQLSKPVMFADIDYEGQNTTLTAKNRGSQQQQRSIDFENLNYDSLPGTSAEGKAIQKIFPSMNMILGKKATETTLKQLKTPQILHLATHGFFLPDQKIKSTENDLNKQENKPVILNLENPLLRSGLALAGFNNRQNKQNNYIEDGVLTALEVAGLNLRGTQLVVLSACETGLGEVKTGDGVYGLRRALVIAGSQSQLLSLWQVSDDGTKDLMVKYYDNLKAGKGRHEALREVQLELIDHPKYKYPYYWASFIPSGNWKGIKDKVH